MQLTHEALTHGAIGKLAKLAHGDMDSQSGSGVDGYIHRIHRSIHIVSASHEKAILDVSQITEKTHVNSLQKLI